MNKPIHFLLVSLTTLSLIHAEQRPPHSLRSPELAAQPQAVTTPEQRQQIIATARSLEKAPFALGATTEREKALWLIDHAPDIFPRLQSRIISDITASGVPDWRPIYAQFVFGFVSFQLDQPKRADDATAVYHAALTSCLHVYRQAVNRDATNRLSFLDAANEQERNGTLAKYVEQVVAALPTQRVE